MTHHPLYQVRSPTDDLPRAVALRALEICRDPQDAATEAVAGAWQAMTMAFVGRESVAAALLEADVLDVAVAHLHKSSAVEWVNWRCGPGLQAGSIVLFVGILCSLELHGMNKVKLMVDCGMADAIASLLKVRRASDWPTPYSVCESLRCWRSLMIRCCLE